MKKIVNAIKTYFASKRLINEQIKKEEELIKENTEDIENLMQREIVQLELKVYGHCSTLDTYYNAIRYHQSNIEKLKDGDIELCVYLMTHELKIDRVRKEMRNTQRNTRECGTLELKAKYDAQRRKHSQ